MWVDVFKDYPEVVSIVILIGYSVGRDVLKSLPGFSIKKMFGKESQKITRSANIVYDEVRSLIKVTQEETQEFKQLVAELRKANEKKDKDIEKLSSAFVGLLSSVNVPLAQKEKMYNMIKSVDVLTQSSLELLKTSIEEDLKAKSEEQSDSKEIDNLIDNNV